MERRLAAVLAADVVAYSRLMGLDEAGTVTALKTCRRDLINYFTVVPAAHASFVQAPVGADTAEPFIHQVHRHRQVPGREFANQQAGVVRGHHGRGTFFTLHGAWQAYEYLHSAEFLDQVGNDPDV